MSANFTKLTDSTLGDPRTTRPSCPPSADRHPRPTSVRTDAAWSTRHRRRRHVGRHRGLTARSCPRDMGSTTRRRRHARRRPDGMGAHHRRDHRARHLRSSRTALQLVVHQRRARRRTPSPSTRTARPSARTSCTRTHREGLANFMTHDGAAALGRGAITSSTRRTTSRATSSRPHRRAAPAAPHSEHRP